MRLWSIHPKYLDRIGLVALWRESLLAQKVLKGETKGYKHHPQLGRFMAHPDPIAAIGKYLVEVWEESRRRGYSFDREKISSVRIIEKIPVTRGQLCYEYDLLCSKLKIRDIDRLRKLPSQEKIVSHQLFEVIEGEVEAKKNILS